MAVSDLNFEFYLSQDEEITELTILSPDRAHNLELRSHHYVTLLLARKKYEDQNNQVAPEEQGWIYSELLARGLGIEANHMNILVHRARK